jgi:hypothetical protein
MWDDIEKFDKREDGLVKIITYLINYCDNNGDGWVQWRNLKFFLDGQNFVEPT